MRKRTLDSSIVRPRIQDSKIAFSQYSIDPINHQEFKTKMLADAQSKAARFPKLLDNIIEQMKTSNALGILSCITSYGLRLYHSENGAEKRISNAGHIEQFQAELLQAILLTVPANELGQGRLDPSAVQAVIDSLKSLTEAHNSLHLIESARIHDDTESLVRKLQDRIRQHTIIVRNWGYFEEVVRLSRRLFSPFDAEFTHHYGFGATDLVDTMLAVVRAYEHKQTEHWVSLRKIARGKTVRQRVRLYYKYYPEFQGDPDQLLSSLPANITTDQVMIVILSSLDIRLVGRAQFTASEISQATGKPTAITEAIFSELSLPLGALAGAEPESLFLENPIWDRPLINTGHAYFIPIPQMFFSHIHRIIGRLSAGFGGERRLSEIRATFLENELESVFRNVFPEADIRSNVHWKLGGQQFETDLIAIVDRTVIIAEAKSNRLTPEGLRGAPARVKRHIQDIVLHPSIQSARLERTIYQAQQGDLHCVASMRELKIDTSSINRVIRLSVMLDDLTSLSSAEPDFKEAGWVPKDHNLAPSLLIADLHCIVEILGNPIILLHYFSERPHLQSTLGLVGDELDILGLYLSTGFNLSALQESGGNLVLDGLSNSIDRYYESMEAGVKVRRPEPALSAYFKKIISKLTQDKPNGWSIAGLSLLSCADPSEQIAIERSLHKLGNLVRRDSRNPERLNSLHVHPPEDHKPIVVFHLYTNKQTADLKNTIKDLAITSLRESSSNECVVFSRNIDINQKDYDRILYFKNRNSEIFTLK